jgi:hypothetical protein
MLSPAFAGWGERLYGFARFADWKNAFSAGWKNASSTG